MLSYFWLWTFQMLVFVSFVAFIKSPEKAELKLLYTNLSALLCNLSIWLFSILLWPIETKGHYSNWERKETFNKSFPWVTGVYQKFLDDAWIFLLALLHKFVTCSLKLSFQSIINPTSISELEFSTEQSVNESIVIIQNLEIKWHLSWFACMLFSWKHLNTFINTLSNFSLLHICFIQ